MRMINYVVQPNDTLAKIAQKYGVTELDIQRANSLPKNNFIYPGIILNIPVKR